MRVAARRPEQPSCGSSESLPQHVQFPGQKRPERGACARVGVGCGKADLAQERRQVGPQDLPCHQQQRTPDPGPAADEGLPPTATDATGDRPPTRPSCRPRSRSASSIAKIDEDQNLVFGWLSVIEENGVPVVDHQDHVIDPAELEKAAYWYVVNSRVAGEMHTRFGFGEGLVESMMFTKEKQAALGIDLGKVGWWVGYRVDDAAFAKVKSGELKAFSIGGRAILENIDELSEAA